jgi:hypothetical protein
VITPPEARIVVVVEEQIDLRDGLVSALRALGYIVVPVPDADSASVVLRKLRPYLVLWNVPVRGQAIAATVSDWKRRRSDAWVVLAGIEEAGPASADFILPAPVVPEQIERLLHRLHSDDSRPTTVTG